MDVSDPSTSQAFWILPGIPFPQQQMRKLKLSPEQGSWHSIHRFTELTWINYSTQATVPASGASISSSLSPTDTFLRRVLPEYPQNSIRQSENGYAHFTSEESRLQFRVPELGLHCCLASHTVLCPAGSWALLLASVH